MNAKKVGPVVIIASLAVGFHFFPALFKKPEVEKPKTLTLELVGEVYVLK